MKIFRKLFGPTQKEIVDAAFLRAATLAAECAKQGTLIELYAALLATIDHNVDWWSWAAAKQAWKDAADAYNAMREEADNAHESAQALIAVNPDVP